MNAPERAMDWVDANQGLLVAEFARLKLRLAGSDEAPARAALDEARAALAGPAAIDVLARSFGLSAFEREILLLAAGVEMDGQLAALCGEALGQPQRPWPSFGLALAVLADPHWSALAPVRPLRRWRLIEIDEASALASARLRVDERVLHYLAGLDFMDPRLASMVRPVRDAAPMAPSHRELGDAIVAGLQALPGELPLVQLNGDDASAREDLALRVATSLGWHLQLLDARALPANAPEVQALAVLWEREAALSAQALLIEGADAPALRPFLERVGGLVFLSASQPLELRRPSQRHQILRPSAAEQLQLWTDALGQAVEPEELAAAASQFRLSARQIAQAAAGLRSKPVVEPGALWQACRSSAPALLAELAQEIEPRAELDDLVLPEAQKQTLAQILVHMQHRFEVHDRWGFAARGSRGLGLTALFAGDSGTGKTLAAEVLARALKLALFRIDLSAVVSKYIGETEKNLRRVFDAAEDSGAMLLFDEADALFGKRSEVKDSHDRYANIEVSYLLQRMEQYRGLAVLTTNHKAALDDAFTRRLRFIIHFPFPEAAEREAIWRRAFPAATPTRDLDFGKLARLQASGGHIQNVALAAAFYAAEAGEPVGMGHLLRATRAEAAKRERVIAEAETRAWV